MICSAISSSKCHFDLTNIANIHALIMAAMDTSAQPLSKACGIIDSNRAEAQRLSSLQLEVEQRNVQTVHRDHNLDMKFARLEQAKIIFEQEQAQVKESQAPIQATP